MRYKAYSTMSFNVWLVINTVLMHYLPQLRLVGSFLQMRKFFKIGLKNMYKLPSKLHCLLSVFVIFAAQVAMGANAVTLETNKSVSNSTDSSTTIQNGAALATASLAPMLEKVLPAVVNIFVRGELPPDREKSAAPRSRHPLRPRNFEAPRKFEDVGTGVIIDAQNGYIVTNHHVVRDAQIITITLKDGRKLSAKIVGVDAPSDVAVLQVKARRLAQFSFGDSDKLRVGDFVSAVGSSFGLEQTVTSGVVSGLERNNLGIEGYENFIQTDASVNPGSSGGALVNMRGELIGVNTAIISPIPIAANIGVGLAIPSNMVASIAAQLIKYGKVERGVLGLLAQDVTPALVEVMHLSGADGAIVSQVMPGTPAATAGIKAKDVIISIMDKPIRSAAQVRNIVSLERVGTNIKLKMWRDNKIIEISAISIDPEKLKAAKQQERKSLFDGVELNDFNQLVDNEQIRGVEVLDMDQSSVAYSCGLRKADIILAAGNRSVAAIDELKKIIAENPKQLLLEVKRAMTGNVFLVLEE